MKFVVFVLTFVCGCSTSAISSLSAPNSGTDSNNINGGSGSGSGTFSGSDADIVSPPPNGASCAAGSAGALADDFEDGQALGWLPYDEPGILNETGGALRIALLQNVAGINFAGYLSASTVDISGSELRVELWPSAQLGNSSEAYFTLYQQDGDGIAIRLRRGWVDFRYESAGEWQNQGSVAYDAVQHHWFRFRENGGVLHIESSADSETWTLLHSVQSSQFTNPNVFVELGAGTSASDNRAPTVLIDNLNGGSGMVLCPSN